MNSTWIETFLLTSRCHSFAEAASRLYLSLASVSRNIAALESEVGVLLFTRSSGQISLTEAGLYYRDAMEGLRDAYRTALDTTKSIASKGQKTLKICVLEGQMLDTVSQTAISTFERRHSDICLELFRSSYGGFLHLLDTGEADVIFTVASCTQMQKGILHEEICPLPSRLVLPQNHPLACKQSLSLSDFRGDTFLVCADSRGEQFLFGRCADAGFVPKVLYAPNIQTQMLWLEAGRGVAISNPYHLMCNSPSLTEVALSDIAPDVFAAAWHEKNTNPAVPLFLQLLKDARRGAQ